MKYQEGKLKVNSVKRALYKLGFIKNSQAPIENSQELIFDRDFYKEITDARLRHFESLSLPLSGKSVIDVGCGIGRFSTFLAEQGADVFCVDGRVENIEKLRELYPSRKCAVVDVESSELLEHGNFDVVFCYGLLYHLADPYGFIKNASKICKEMMIIETCIMDAADPVVRLVPEDQQNATQALHTMGCRPSPSYVNTCLKLSGFEYIYKPAILPAHTQFDYKLSNDYSYLKQGRLIRDIFIASRIKIATNLLCPI
ncbi:MAG: methyltransferase domain-containing protein [Gallionella sp.]